MIETILTFAVIVFAVLCAAFGWPIAVVVTAFILFFSIAVVIWLLHVLSGPFHAARMERARAPNGLVPHG